MTPNYLIILEEFAINEKLLGECNHPNHITETERGQGFELIYLICTKCGQKFLDDYQSRMDSENADRPDDYCKKFIPLYCHDVIMARKLLRLLEDRGWKYFFTNKNNLYICHLSKGIRKFKSDEMLTEQASICNAAYKACNSM